MVDTNISQHTLDLIGNSTEKWALEYARFSRELGFGDVMSDAFVLDYRKRAEAAKTPREQRALHRKKLRAKLKNTKREMVCVVCGDDLGVRIDVPYDASDPRRFERNTRHDKVTCSPRCRQRRLRAQLKQVD